MLGDIKLKQALWNCTLNFTSPTNRTMAALHNEAHEAGRHLEDLMTAWVERFKELFFLWGFDRQNKKLINVTVFKNLSATGKEASPRWQHMLVSQVPMHLAGKNVFGQKVLTSSAEYVYVWAEFWRRRWFKTLIINHILGSLFNSSIFLYMYIVFMLPWII